jgi:hypothetical protein
MSVATLGCTDSNRTPPRSSLRRHSPTTRRQTTRARTHSTRRHDGDATRQQRARPWPTLVPRHHARHRQRALLTAPRTRAITTAHTRALTHLEPPRSQRQRASLMPLTISRTIIFSYRRIATNRATSGATHTHTHTPRQSPHYHHINTHSRRSNTRRLCASPSSDVGTHLRSTATTNRVTALNGVDVRSSCSCARTLTIAC